MGVGDAVGVGVCEGEGVAGEGEGEGDAEGVAPGDRVGEGDAVGEGVLLSRGTLTVKVALPQVDQSGTLAHHSTSPVAHRVTLSVMFEMRPQEPPWRGARMRLTGGTPPCSAYCTHQSCAIESPLATLPGEVTPEFQFSSTPLAQPPMNPPLPLEQGAPRAMFKPEALYTSTSPKLSELGNASVGSVGLE